MVFKIGSFNILPTFAVMTTCIAGIGLLPLGARRLLTGEWPTIEDAFESYLWWKPGVFDVGAPYAATASFRRDAPAAVAGAEAEWRALHAAAGNTAPRPLQ